MLGGCLCAEAPLDAGVDTALLITPSSASHYLGKHLPLSVPLLASPSEAPGA